MELAGRAIKRDVESAYRKPCEERRGKTAADESEADKNEPAVSFQRALHSLAVFLIGLLLLEGGKTIKTCCFLSHGDALRSEAAETLLTRCRCERSESDKKVCRPARPN